MLEANHAVLPFTGWVIIGYSSAVAFLGALTDVGLKIPEDASVVVLDNPDIHSQYGELFTMIGQSSGDIADSMIERVEQRWQNPELPYCLTQRVPRVEIRKSTAPPK